MTRCPRPIYQTKAINAATASSANTYSASWRPFPADRKPSRSARPRSELQSKRLAHSLKSRAVQSQGCERGVREVAAAGKAEGLQPVAAPANLHHALIRDALGKTKTGRHVRRHQRDWDGNSRKTGSAVRRSVCTASYQHFTLVI